VGTSSVAAQLEASEKGLSSVSKKVSHVIESSKCGEETFDIYSMFKHKILKENLRLTYIL
jgi:hypothetical protein